MKWHRTTKAEISRKIDKVDEFISSFVLFSSLSAQRGKFNFILHVSSSASNELSSISVWISACHIFGHFSFVRNKSNKFHFSNCEIRQEEKHMETEEVSKRPRKRIKSFHRWSKIKNKNSLVCARTHKKYIFFSVVCRVDSTMINKNKKKPEFFLLELSKVVKREK